jgi:hypothetical protein
MGDLCVANDRWLQLSGRLGNELFQWSYAHNLAISNSCKVNLFHDKYHQGSAVDIEFLSLINCQHVRYVGHVDDLGFQLKILDWLGAYSLRTSKFVGQVYGWRRSLDAHTAILPPINNLKHSGFFQNYRQVEAVSGIVVCELREILDSIQFQSRVDLPNDFQFAHIRRGDLVSLNTIYGLLGKDWYRKCRDLSLPLVLSSDDVDACQDVITELKPEIILNSQNYSALETLAVMSRSKDIIMANSTLSWWGGYLASKNGARVHFPDPFYIGNYAITDALCMPDFERTSSVFNEN